MDFIVVKSVQRRILRRRIPPKKYKTKRRLPCVARHRYPTKRKELGALAEYGFDEEQPATNLDFVVQIAARMFDMPMAAINMICSDHVFFAASTGKLNRRNVRREVSFCAHAITQGDVLVVPDATQDLRFHDNPLVTEAGGIRFYAGVPLRAPSGHALGALCVVDSRPRSDFSERECVHLRDLGKLVADKLELRRLEVASRSGLIRFQNIAATSPDAVVCIDQSGVVTIWNHAAEIMFGYSSAEAIGQSIVSFVPDDFREQIRSEMQRAVMTGESNLLGKATEFVGLRKDGSQFPTEFSASRWQEKGSVSFGVIVRDITERRRMEEDFHRIANQDRLTGLTNRNVLSRRVTELIDERCAASVIMIDLDGFKDVNDTLGHAVGDAVLKEVARRLLDCVVPTDTVSRIGGDEFAILLPGCEDSSQASAVADLFIETLRDAILIDGHDVRVAASCGVAVFPLHGQEADELIGNADLALYQAKIEGRGRVRIFVPALRMAAIARRMYHSELHRAVENSEFRLFYQPQVRLSDGSLSGAEALIRWQHPERGLLAPGAFLPALEGGPLAATVGDWVLQTACAQAATWRDQGIQGFRMGVNLFAAQFRADDLAIRVRATLAQFDLRPDVLELEITENIIIHQHDAVLPLLEKLSLLGVGIAFDDYGTGYASLSMLTQFPITRLKIDRSFVRNICTSDPEVSIVQAILDLGRKLKMDIIAEGIETKEQHHLLRLMGCAEGQGYLFGKPMPLQEFESTFGLYRKTSSSATSL